VTGVGELDAGARRLGQLHEAMVSVTTGVDRAAVLQQIVDLARDLVRARYAAMVVSDPMGTRLVESATIEADDVRPAPSGARLLAPDPLPYLDAFTLSGAGPPTTTVLEIPVSSRGEVFGTLYLTDREGEDGFSDVDEALALALATAAALALENAGFRERADGVAVPADRERIGRDLHNTVVQRLFAIGLAMHGTAELTRKTDVAARLEAHIDDLDGTIREVRSVIFAIDTADATG
jgi:signal transduction histidine kinase